MGRNYEPVCIVCGQVVKNGFYCNKNNEYFVQKCVEKNLNSCTEHEFTLHKGLQAFAQLD